MREGDPAFRALRDAIDAVAADDAPDLIAEARVEARAKVRTILADAMAEALLERASGALARDPDRPPRQRAPAPAREDGWYVFGVVREGAVDAPAGTELM